VSVGTAGAIGSGLVPGDLVVCSGALRDEGTSHHYAPPERFALPDEGLTGRLRAQLPTAVSGLSWTTDAPYRETAEEIMAYRGEGILTVDMEAAPCSAARRSVGASLPLRGGQAGPAGALRDGGSLPDRDPLPVPLL